MVKRGIAIAICLASWAVVAVGVPSANVEARKIMEFGKVRWEDEMARLDYLESNLREEPQSIAYILVYGGRRGAKRGDTEARMKCIKDYMLKRRGVRTDRVVLMNGGYREESSVELWLVPRGESGPKATPTVSPKEVKFKKGRMKNWRGRCNL